MVALLVLLTIITFLTIDYFAQRAAARRTVPAPAARTPAVRFPADLGAIPAGVFLGPGHAWVGVEPSGAVRIGADRVPLTLLGGVDAVEPVAAGTEVRRGDPIARLVRGARAVDLPSPVAGVVVAVNSAADPASVAADPFGRGWIATLRPTKLAGALRRLFVAEEASAWMRDELARLRDALVGLSVQGAVATATLPDGGLPLTGAAERLSEEQWRQVVERFFTADVD